MMDNLKYVLERLKAEESDLCKKIEDLQKFINSEEFIKLNEIQQTTLVSQCTFMKGYFDCLNVRIIDIESSLVKTEGSDDCKEELVGEGEGFNRIRRITGYLVGDMRRWNNAKRSEERDRVKHTGSGVDINAK